MELAPSVVSTVEIPADLSNTSFNLFPNPANASVTLQFPSTVGAAKLTIMTAAGEVVGTQQIDATSGLTRTSMNTAQLTPGMYLVRVVNGTATFALPMTIVR